MNEKPSHPLSRREFLAASAVNGAALAGSSHATASETRPSSARDWTKVRGFNYQPSYGSSGFELWRKFDAKVIDRELGLGKKYFPGMNAIRLWLSWDASLRDPKKYAADFDQVLGIADRYGLVVMPVLFNRWHDAVLDYGGIYIDHFLPRASWVQSARMFDAYLEAIVGAHAGDSRILAWDLCNEPYSYSCPREEIPQIAQAETAWLQGLYDQCKKLGAKAPITVGIHPGVPVEMIDKISDVISIHPYFVHNDPNAKKEAFEQKLDAEAAFARKVGKPIIASETCWGSLDDKVRVESMRYTLEQLKKRDIGWLAYLLHHSLIADAHRPEYGPVGFPGYLGFIEADDTLRTGHEAFNEY